MGVMGKNTKAGLQFTPETQDRTPPPPVSSREQGRHKTRIALACGRRGGFGRRLENKSLADQGKALLRKFGL